MSVVPFKWTMPSRLCVRMHCLATIMDRDPPAAMTILSRGTDGMLSVTILDEHTSVEECQRMLREAADRLQP